MASVASASLTYLQHVDACILREASYPKCMLLKKQCFLPGKPTEVSKQLEDKTAAAGQDISLSCELSKPDLNIRWYKDGKAIRKSQKYDLQQEGTGAILIIHDSTAKDSGEYPCETEDSITKARVTVQGELKSTLGMACREVEVNICSLWVMFFSSVSLSRINS